MYFFMSSRAPNGKNKSYFSAKYGKHKQHKADDEDEDEVDEPVFDWDPDRFGPDPRDPPDSGDGSSSSSRMYQVSAYSL